MLDNLGPPLPQAFRDRSDAGRQLAELLAKRRDDRSTVVLAIPRGGVPVAAEVARMLRAPLDVTVVGKVSAPQNPEYAIGALAEGGVRIFDEQAVHVAGLSECRLDDLAAGVEYQLLERLARYRRARVPVTLSGRTAVLVDDGLATGRSALAALQSLYRRGAARVLLAVPVGAVESIRMLARHVEEVVCVHELEDLRAVGYWYEDFQPTTDEEVIYALTRRYDTPSSHTQISGQRR